MELSPPEPVDERRERWIRRGLACLTVLLLVGGVASLAAGRAADDRPPAEVVAAAAGAVDQTSVATELRLSLGGAGTEFTTTVTGAFDPRSDVGRVTVAVGPMGQFELLVLGDRVYLKVPEAQVAANGGKHWVSAPGADLPAAAAQLNADPRAFVDFLGAVSGPITEIGGAEVRGVDTRHFRFDIDLGKLLARTPAQAGQFDQLQGLGVETLPTELWVDDEDRPRRLRFALGVKGTEVDVQMELFDYGKPVEVVAPDPVDVREVPDVMQLFQALSVPR